MNGIVLYYIWAHNGAAKQATKQQTDGRKRNIRKRKFIYRKNETDCNKFSSYEKLQI